MKIELEYINKLPVFITKNPKTLGSKIFGASLDKSKEFWRYPAFPPFLDRVLHDLEEVYKHLDFSPEAQNYLDNQHTEEEWFDYARNVTLPGSYKSYQHQSEGLGRLLCNYRYILQWEMGTGKTKPVIDLAYLLRKKVLVLCPPVAIGTWLKEVEKHTDSTLSAVGMTGTRKRKLKILNNCAQKDFLIVSYDTARRYGIPTVFGQARKLVLEKKQREEPISLTRALRMVNDPKKQTQLMDDWIKGREVKDIKEEVKDLTRDSYQWISQLTEFSIIVADESHRIKTIESQRTKVCMRLAAKFSRRYLLSGTLSLGDPRDLYPQLKFLAPYILPTQYDKFCRKHIAYAHQNKPIVVGYKKLDELNRLVSWVSDQKKLADCVDLPERTFVPLYFDLTQKQRKDYNEAITDMSITRYLHDPLEIQNNAICLSKLLQICSGFYYDTHKLTDICDDCPYLRQCIARGTQPGSSKCVYNKTQLTQQSREIVRYSPNPKLEFLNEFLDNLLNAPNNKVIIWANFIAELDDIEKILQAKKLKYVRADGTNTSQMYLMESTFQTDPSCRIFLGQVSVGISITLTAAKYTIYYSRNWSLENWLQSQNRNYRIGQEEKTVVYILCGRHTVEIQQLSALRSKKDIASTLTQHINCLICSRYSKCLKEGIEPWSDDCILQKNVIKQPTRAGIIELQEDTKEDA